MTSSANDQSSKLADSTAGEQFTRLIERLQNEPAPRKHFPNNLRDLDQEIYLLLGLYQTDDEGCALLYMAPNYTTSLDAAMALVPEGWNWSAGVDSQGSYATADTDYGMVEIDQRGAIPALALCIAALRARSPAAPSDNKPERSIADETGGGR